MTSSDSPTPDVSVDGLVKAAIDFHQEHSARLFFENGPIRQWRCPFCEKWRQYTEAVCRCGITRDGGPQAQLDDLLKTGEQAFLNPSIKIDRF
jgi:hypothetical protein